MPSNRLFSQLLKLIQAIVLLPYHLVGHIICHFPGPLGYPLRRLWWRLHLASMGSGVIIEPGVVINTPQQVFISNDVHLDRGVVIIAGHRPNDPRVKKTIKRTEYPYESGEIHIGQGVHIAHYAVLVGHGGILIGDWSGIGAHVCLYSASIYRPKGIEELDQKQYLFTNRVSDSKQSLIVGPIVVEACAGVGAHACVLPGSLVPSGVWVKAGQVVRGFVAG